MFMVKSKIGYEIDNWLKKNPEEQAHYKSLGIKERRDYRIRWTENKGQLVDKELQAMEILEIVETSSGEMYSARRISVELGNDDSAALRYCRSCLKLGPSEWMVEECRPDELDL